MKTLNDLKTKKPWEVEGVEWREVRLGDDYYFHIETGATPKTSVKEYWENGTIKWATPKDLGKNKGKYLIDTERKITEAGLNSCSTTIIPKGSIIISTRAPIGHIAILGDDMCFNQGCKGLVINNNFIYNEFVYYALLKRVEIMKTLGTGPTFEEISKDKLASIKIPLPFRNGKPDLETQKKIVEYIEENLSRIDKILEKKKKELELLDELWKSVLEEAFKPREGEEWREVRLGELTTENPRYGLTAKAKDSGEFVFLRITDIDDKGEIKTNNFKFADIDNDEASKYEIKQGDLLLARSGSVGNFFIAFKDYPKWVYGSYLIRFRLDTSKVNLNFVKHFLSSQYFKRWVSYQKRHGVQPNINAEEYSSFKLPIPFRNGKPDLEKQKEIANYLDSVYGKIKTLKEKIQNQITQLEEMKESILDEVFNHDSNI